MFHFNPKPRPPRYDGRETIGHAVSSGCFRLVNEQIEDLYDRVKVGAKVIVQQ